METTGQRLIQSLQEAIGYATKDTNLAKTTHVKKIKMLEIPGSINVKEIREHLNLSQAEFAAKFGINLNTLKNWEHGRRIPDLATKSYLYAISRHADLIEKALYS